MPVGVIGLGLLAFFFYRRRVRSKSQHAGAEPHEAPTTTAAKELDTPSNEKPKEDSPLTNERDTLANELPGKGQPMTELPSGHEVQHFHELDGRTV